MVERQPNRPPIPEPQRTSHEGGNGAPGLPPTVHERAKPPPESPQRQPQNAEGNPPVENPSLTTRRGAVFDCFLPKSKEPPSLFRIQQMFRDGMRNIEEVPGLEQQWLDYLKTLDTQALETKLQKSEASWENYKDMQKRKALTAHGEGLLPALEEDVKLIRAELRRR